MREILFRGRQADTGKWVYGYFFEDIGAFIKERSSSVTTDTHLVEKASVGQYTGLKDRSGQKIFEGDILSLPEEEYANIKLLVEFRDCGWKLRWHGDKNFNHELAAWDGKRLNFKVVGNIHDNPELLEGGGEE